MKGTFIISQFPRGIVLHGCSSRGASEEHREGPMARNPRSDPGSLPTFLTRVMTPGFVFFKKGGNPPERAPNFNSPQMIIRCSSDAHSMIIQCSSGSVKILFWDILDVLWILFKRFLKHLQYPFNSHQILIQCSFIAHPMLIQWAFNALWTLFWRWFKKLLP